MRGKTTAAWRVVVIVAALLMGNGAAEALIQDDRLRVSGAAQVELAPDQALIWTNVRTLAYTAEEAQGENAEKATRILEALRELGVEEEDIRTHNITIWQRWDYTREQRIFLGYEARHNLVIKIRDLEKAGTILDRLVQVGQAELDRFEFQLSDRSSAETAAVELAIQQARSRAEAMARAAGVKLGAPVRIVDETDVRSSARDYYRGYIFAEAAAAYSETPAQPGLISVEARVTVDYEIESDGVK